MKKVIDLRSDTVTQPTKEMRQAMYNAEVVDTSHIYNLEVGAMAAISQVQPRTTRLINGLYNIEELEALIQEEGIQKAKTSLICIENTNNLNA